MEEGRRSCQGTGVELLGLGLGLGLRLVAGEIRVGLGQGVWAAGTYDVGDHVQEEPLHAACITALALLLGSWLV